MNRTVEAYTNFTPSVTADSALTRQSSPSSPRHRRVCCPLSFHSLRAWSLHPPLARTRHESDLDCRCRDVGNRQVCGAGRLTSLVIQGTALVGSRYSYQCRYVLEGGHLNQHVVKVTDFTIKDLQFQHIAAGHVRLDSRRGVSNPIKSASVS